MKSRSLMPMMAFASLLVCCDKKETPTEPAAPKASIVVVPVPTPAKAVPVEVTSPPLAIPVEDQSPDEEEPSAPDTDVIQPSPGQRLDRAIEKTEQGVRTAAGETGRALQRAGEAIERQAEEPKKKP
ncbi:MAG: hypothetical protein WCH40_05830 [Verrucomicrobiales bacterium]